MNTDEIIEAIQGGNKEWISIPALKPDKPELESSLTTYQLCDFGLI